MSRGKDKPILHTHYDNMLRAYFHQPPKFDYSTFGSVLRDVVGLTDIAESLGSVPCVSNALNLALVAQGEILYRSIAANAEVWGELALRIRSEIVFRESVVHLVGQWHSLSSDVMNRLSVELREICQTKFTELDERKKSSELKILGHYPASLQVMLSQNQNVGAGSRTIRGKGVPTRASQAYGSQIMGWMALSLFRHWLGQSIAGDMSRRACDGGLAFYTAIAEAGEKYLNQGSREAFVRHFPLSAKARTQFDRAINDIKEEVKVYVTELVKKRCTLDVSRWPVTWLTCTEVSREDLPWVGEEEARQLWENVGSRPGQPPAKKAKSDKSRAQDSTSRREDEMTGTSDPGDSASAGTAKKTANANNITSLDEVDSDSGSEVELTGQRFSGNGFSLKRVKREPSESSETFSPRDSGAECSNNIPRIPQHDASSTPETRGSTVKGKGPAIEAESGIVGGFSMNYGSDAWISSLPEVDRIVEPTLDTNMEDDIEGDDYF